MYNKSLNLDIKQLVVAHCLDVFRLLYLDRNLNWAFHTHFTLFYSEHVFKVFVKERSLQWLWTQHGQAGLTLLRSAHQMQFFLTSVTQGYSKWSENNQWSRTDWSDPSVLLRGERTNCLEIIEEQPQVSAQCPDGRLQHHTRRVKAAPASVPEVTSHIKLSPLKIRANWCCYISVEQNAKNVCSILWKVLCRLSQCLHIT